MSGDFLSSFRFVGSLNDFAFLEYRAGADQGDQVRRADGSPKACAD
jgi:hypothetical protein